MKILDIESYEDDLVEKLDDELKSKFNCVFYDPEIDLSSERRLDELYKIIEHCDDDVELLVVHDLALTPQTVSDLIHEQPKRMCAFVFNPIKQDLTVINLRRKGDDSIEQKFMQNFFKKYDGSWYDENEDQIESIVSTLRFSYDKGLM